MWIKHSFGMGSVGGGIFSGLAFTGICVTKVDV